MLNHINDLFEYYAKDKNSLIDSLGSMIEILMYEIIM